MRLLLGPEHQNEIQASSVRTPERRRLVPDHGAPRDGPARCPRATRSLVPGLFHTRQAPAFSTRRTGSLKVQLTTWLETRFEFGTITSAPWNVRIRLARTPIRWTSPARLPTSRTSPIRIGRSNCSTRSRNEIGDDVLHAEADAYAESPRQHGQLIELHAGRHQRHQ